MLSELTLKLTQEVVIDKEYIKDTKELFERMNKNMIDPKLAPRGRIQV